MFISLGVQCLPASIMKTQGVRTCALPFDYIFCSPVTIYNIIYELLTNKNDSKTIADTYLFNSLKRCSNSGHQQYYDDENGTSYYSTHYCNVFPHHDVSDLNVQKMFVSRLDRLKYILSSSEEIFMFHMSFAKNNVLSINGEYVYPSEHICMDVLHNLLGFLKSNRPNKKTKLVHVNNIANVSSNCEDVVVLNDNNVYHVGEEFMNHTAKNINLKSLLL